MTQRTLAQAELGETLRIDTVGGTGELRQHFLDMGVIPGAAITFVKFAPMGDPMEFTLRGYQLTLRVADAEKIGVLPLPEGEVPAPEAAPAAATVRHPGLGEMGGTVGIDERTRDHSDPIPEGQTLTFALAGNQNCGKTTLFNQLTGANQHVGNFPGVTVDRKSGQIKGHPDTDVTDLPGIYSLSPYSPEELVSRRYILDERPSGIINIVDATNIERNLYLTMQLMELDCPMVLALNMMDEVQGNGGTIDVNVLEDALGIPVVPISALKNSGVSELVEHALHVARYRERPGRQDFCDPTDHDGALHRCLHAIMHLVEDHAERASVPVRFAATKLIEGDELTASALGLDQAELDTVERIVSQMEQERGLDRAAAIADMRFSFIERVVSAAVVKPRESRERETSRRIDRLLTGKWTALPLFVLIMGAVFVLTFNVIGAFLQQLVADGVDSLVTLADEGLTAAGANPVLHSLIVDGALNAVSTIVPITPIVVTMFFFLSLLEDTGYMARVAFVMDKPLRRLGLSGRSIVPMLMGFGCTVPAVMSARTLPSERDRRLTIALTPFMSCTTKLTIYGFFAAIFFPGHAALAVISMYVIGILVGLLAALIVHKTIDTGEAVPFVMELPNYRMPSAKSVLLLVWEKSKDFLTRAFTVVFVAAVVVWFLQSFSPSLALVEDKQDSILAAISTFVAPLFSPLGFGDWRFATALVAGFMAKEIVASTLSVLFGSAAEVMAVLSPLAAFCLMVFCLLYTPCVAAIAAVRRELGGRWAAGIVVFQCVVAYAVALLVRLVGLALGLG